MRQVQMKLDEIAEKEARKAEEARIAELAKILVEKLRLEVEARIAEEAR